MDIEDFNTVVPFQIFAQFGDVYVHAAGSKIVVVPPDLCQCKFPWHKVVLMQRKEP
jgi:hypothetical protein